MPPRRAWTCSSASRSGRMFSSSAGMRSGLAVAAARFQEVCATRSFDVEGKLKLLVPGPAAVEEGEKMAQISHMFSRTPDAAFDKKKLRCPREKKTASPPSSGSD